MLWKLEIVLRILNHLFEKWKLLFISLFNFNIKSILYICTTKIIRFFFIWKWTFSKRFIGLKNVYPKLRCNVQYKRLKMNWDPPTETPKNKEVSFKEIFPKRNFFCNFFFLNLVFWFYFHTVFFLLNSNLRGFILLSYRSKKESSPKCLIKKIE